MFKKEMYDAIDWLYKKEPGLVKAIALTDTKCENCKKMQQEVFSELEKKYDWFTIKYLDNWQVPFPASLTPMVYFTYGLMKGDQRQPELRAGAATYKQVEDDLLFMKQMADTQKTPSELMNILKG